MARIEKKDEPNKQQKSATNLIEDKEVDYGEVTLKDARKFLSFSSGIAGFSLYFLVSVIVALL